MRFSSAFRTSQYIYIYIYIYKVNSFAEICQKIAKSRRIERDSFGIKRNSAKSSRIYCDFCEFLQNVRKTEKISQNKQIPYEFEYIDCTGMRFIPVQVVIDQMRLQICPLPLSFAVDRSAHRN